jgi:hypothetical protein
MVSMPSRQTTNADAARSSRHSYLPNCSRMAIRVAYYFSYRAYLVLYWPDSDFENHLQLDAGVEPVTEPRALGAFINLMGKAGYAPILISRQYGILRGSNCRSKAAASPLGVGVGCPIYNCGAQEARGTLKSRWPSNQVKCVFPASLGSA